MSDRTESQHPKAHRDVFAGVAEDSDRIIDLRGRPGVEEPDDLALRPYQVARRLGTEAEILAAKRLHAQVYLASGFIAPQDVDSDGTINTLLDPWTGAATYFAVIRQGVPVATARQICGVDPGRLPALTLADPTSPDVERIIASLTAEEVVEISALSRGRNAGASDVMAVYVGMWQESLRLGHRVWVMAVDVRVFQLLRSQVCGEALRRVGAPQVYLGSVVVPAVVWCDELVPEQQRMAARAGVPGTLRSFLPRLFSAPKVEAG